MKADPILEEVWRVKEELAREAGYDVRRLCENTRRWAEQHPPSGTVIHNAEELRQYVRQREGPAAFEPATQSRA
jgi:hypothetical protein